VTDGQTDKTAIQNTEQVASGS